ncbi:MAG: hypothetical protein ACREA0_03805, partial [bacterium]
MLARSRDGSTDEAEDTTAVRLFVRPSGSREQPRRSARVKALRAAFGGALRAALTRAPAGGLSTAMRRRQGLRRRSINGRT